MTKRVFYSFHFDNDCHRVQQIRNIGALDGNGPVSPQRWETVKRGGRASVERWIEDNMYGKGAVIVLVGSETASRPWVRYEIECALQKRKKLLGVRIHGLKDIRGNTSSPGANPFKGISYKGTDLANLVDLHDPDGWDSKDRYACIRDNIEDWIDEGFDGQVTQTIFGTTRPRKRTLFG